MAGKLPWFKFFADKWISDERLGACSIGAQGLWIRLLCLMHKNSRRGFLQQENGQPLSNAQLARLTGCTTDEVAHLLRELTSAGVASVSSSGVVYSRLMEREENKRRLCSDAGKKGGGNPTFKGVTKGQCKGDDKPSSSLLYVASEKVGGRGEGKTAPPLDHTAPGLAQQWVFYCTRRTATGVKADTEAKVEAEFGEMLRRGHDGARILAAVIGGDRDLGQQLFEFKQQFGFDGPPLKRPQGLEVARKVEGQRRADEAQRKKVEAEGLPLVGKKERKPCKPTEPTGETEPTAPTAPES